MRIHPEDAKTLGLEDGDLATCRLAWGEIAGAVELDHSLRRGVVAVPHGYGKRHAVSRPIGIEFNWLHMDSWAKKGSTSAPTSCD